jgi:hypothetical protein
MRCPVCKADNIQGPNCRRCKADLSLLFTLEDQRRRALTQARLCFRCSQWPQAAHHAEEANWMRGDEESLRLEAMAHLLRRDFAAAWESYQRWRNSRRGED